MEKENDIKLTCKECGNEFTFSEGEQKWYAERGFYPPKKCPVCRLRVKQ